jgi:hypothetical protein
MPLVGLRWMHWKFLAGSWGNAPQRLISCIRANRSAASDGWDLIFDLVNRRRTIMS